jgi:hypothetical protein
LKLFIILFAGNIVFFEKTTKSYYNTIYYNKIKITIKTNRMGVRGNLGFPTFFLEKRTTKTNRMGCGATWVSLRSF